MYHDPQYTPLRQLFFCSLRLSFILDCASRADDNSPVPEIQLASNVSVKFGQYDNTDDWYAYVSWSPINGALLAYCLSFIIPNNANSSNKGVEKKLAKANKQKSKKRGKKKEKALLAFAPEHRDPLIQQAKQCNFVSGFFKTVIEPGDRWQKVKFSPEDKYFH